MARCEPKDLCATGVEQKLRTDQDCVGSLLLQTCKGDINVTDCARVNDLYIPSNIRSSCLSFSDQRLGN